MNTPTASDALKPYIHHHGACASLKWAICTQPGCGEIHDHKCDCGLDDIFNRRASPPPAAPQESVIHRPNPDHPAWCIANAALVDEGMPHGCNCPLNKPSPEISESDLVRLARPPAPIGNGTTVGTQSVAHLSPAAVAEAVKEALSCFRVLVELRSDDVPIQTLRETIIPRLERALVSLAQAPRLVRATSKEPTQDEYQIANRIAGFPGQPPEKNDFVLRNTIAEALVAHRLRFGTGPDARVRVALERYGRHEPGCTRGGAQDYECTCGLDAALAPAKETGNG